MLAHPAPCPIAMRPCLPAAALLAGVLLPEEPLRAPLVAQFGGRHRMEPQRCVVYLGGDEFHSVSVHEPEQAS